MPVKLVIGVETEKEKILRKEFVFENTKVTKYSMQRNVDLGLNTYIVFLIYDKMLPASIFYLSQARKEKHLKRIKLRILKMEEIESNSLLLPLEKGSFLPTASANEEQTLRKA